MLNAKDKPVVYFVGEPRFWMWDVKSEVASLDFVLYHPFLGDCPNVRTSVVKQKFSDGSFETLNTIYKPTTKEMYDEYFAKLEGNRKELEEWYENNRPTFSQTGLARSQE